MLVLRQRNACILIIAIPLSPYLHNQRTKLKTTTSHNNKSTTHNMYPCISSIHIYSHRRKLPALCCSNAPRGYQIASSILSTSVAFKLSNPFLQRLVRSLYREADMSRAKAAPDPNKQLRVKINVCRRMCVLLLLVLVLVSFGCSMMGETCGMRW